MDIRLQLLLRRYHATHDPNDAVAYINNVLRQGEAEEEIFIWVVQAQPDPDGSDDIALFFTEKSAYQHAAEIVANTLENETLAFVNAGEDIPDWFDQFEQLCEERDFRSAFSLYDSPQRPAHHLPYDPMVTVYQEKIAE